MSVRTISTKLAIDGEAQYKQSIASCNAELRTLKSSLALVNSEYRNNANSIEALSSKGAALTAIQSEQAKKVSELEKALANAQDHQQAYADAAAFAGEKVAEYSAALDNLKDSADDTQQEQAELTAELEKWQKAQAESENANRAAAKGVQSWQKQLNDAKIELNYLSDEIDRNNQHLDEARASADGCASSIDQYGKEVRKAGDDAHDFGEKSKVSIEQLAGVLASAGIAKGAKEIADALLECSKSAAAFETTVAKISTIADTSAMPLDEMSGKIIQLSGDVNIAASSIGEAVYQALSSGVETTEAVKNVEKAAKLAYGGFTSVETSVDVLTTALNAYKLKATETEKISDILITTQKRGKTTVDELAQSVGKVIPLAAAYNVQMDDLGTSYAVLTANGVATAEAGTYLKAMINELGDSGSKVAGILRDQTGKSFAELKAGGKSLGDILAVVGDSVGGSATAFNELWSSTEAGVGALSIFNTGAEHFNSVLLEMQNSAGATEEAYQKMAGTAEFSQQRMSNAAENLKIAIGDQLNPALGKLYAAGADAFGWATDFIADHPGVVDAVAAVTVGVGTLTVGLTLAANAASIAAVAQGALNAVMNANPAFLLAAAVTALGAAITAYSLTLDSVDEKAKTFTKSLQESQAAYEELMESMSEESSSVSASVKSLEALLAVEDKSAAQKDVILKKVEELNQAIPGLDLAYDAVSDSINMTSDALERMAESAGDQKEYEAQVARLNELYTEQAGLTDQLTETQAALDEALANAQWDSFGGAMNDAAANVGVLQGSMESLTIAQEENAAQIAELEAATQAMSERQAEAAASTQDITNTTEEMTSRVEAAIEEVKSMQAAYEESYAAAMESINAQVKLFEELDGSAKTSVDNLIDTLKGQVAYMETYADNIQKAMEMGVDQGLIRKLSDGSEESAQILAAIVQGGTEDIAALNEQLAKVEEGKQEFSKTVAEMETDFQNKMDAVVDDMNQAIQDMNLKNDAYTIGKNNMQGLIDGTASQRAALVAKYAEMGRAALNAYKREVKQASPSKAFYEAGSFDIQGIISGAESEKAKLDAAYQDMARTALESMERGLPSTIMEPKAVNQGDQIPAVIAAINNLAGSSGGQGSQGQAFSYADLIAAFREALSGMEFRVNQRKLAELTSAWQSNNARSLGV